METVGFVLGTSFASGLNLYATVALLGLLQKFEVIQLKSPLAALVHPAVIGVAVALYLIEFVADKIPYVDNMWDAVHTFIRPAAAALLSYGVLVEVPDSWRIIIAMFAGGIALTSHGTKATTRLALNASPEPVSNTIASSVEDVAAVLLTWLAATHPFLVFWLVLLLLAISIYLMIRFYSFIRILLRNLFRRKTASGGAFTDVPG